MAYKVASKLAQEKLRRPVGELLPNYFETLSNEQQREVLQAVVKNIVKEIAEEKDYWRKKELGKKQAEICMMINKLRPKKHGPKSVANYFIEVARERLPKHTYSSIMDEASKRAKQNEKTPNF